MANNVNVLAEGQIKFSKKGDTETLYFALAADDEISIKLTELNNYPIGSIKFYSYSGSNYLLNIEEYANMDKQIIIKQDGIYCFRLENNNNKDKLLNYKITREPFNDYAIRYDTRVYWRTVYDTVYRMENEPIYYTKFKVSQVLKNTVVLLNSINNARWQGGTCKETLYLNTLPQKTLFNTPRLCYWYVATPNMDYANSLKSQYNLYTKVSEALYGEESVSSLNKINPPPHGDGNCKITLFGDNNAVPGYSSSETTGLFIMDPSVLISNYSIGIENNNSTNKIYIVIGAVAVTKETLSRDNYVERRYINSKTYPYTKN